MEFVAFGVEFELGDGVATTSTEGLAVGLSVTLAVRASVGASVVTPGVGVHVGAAVVLSGVGEDVGEDVGATVTVTVTGVAVGSAVVLKSGKSVGVGASVGNSDWEETPEIINNSVEATKYEYRHGGSVILLYRWDILRWLTVVEA